MPEDLGACWFFAEEEGQAADDGGPGRLSGGVVAILWRPERTIGFGDATAGLGA